MCATQFGKIKPLYLNKPASTWISCHRAVTNALPFVPVPSAITIPWPNLQCGACCPGAASTKFPIHHEQMMTFWKLGPFIHFQLKFHGPADFHGIFMGFPWNFHGFVPHFAMDLKQQCQLQPLTPGLPLPPSSHPSPHLVKTSEDHLDSMMFRPKMMIYVYHIEMHVYIAHISSCFICYMYSSL